jgi:hypothetical protein
MTGLVRKATLLTACGMLLAAAAMAGVPSPANSTTPGAVLLVGRNAVGPDTTDGVFQVVVRDLANNPINASSVVVDFAGAADLKVCSDQYNTESTVNCAAKTIRRFTDASGTVRFTLIGGSTGAGVSDRGTAKIFADGVLLSSTSSATGLIAAAADLDGLNGVTGADIGKILNDIGAVGLQQRSDLDFNGTNAGADIGKLLTILGGARSTQSCASVCP